MKSTSYSVIGLHIQFEKHYGHRARSSLSQLGYHSLLRPRNTISLSRRNTNHSNTKPKLVPNARVTCLGTLYVVCVVNLRANTEYVLSQNWPKKFSAQSHVTPGFLSVHEPPLSHGMSVQRLSPVADKEIPIR